MFEIEIWQLLKISRSMKYKHEIKELLCDFRFS